MSQEVYTAFTDTFRVQVRDFSYEQQLGVLSIILAALNETKKGKPRMSKEERLNLFHKFTGSLHVPADFDPREEYLSYLDERYGV